ncbi:MAG: hypothetical protein LBI78_07750 [Campylobacteraceae bacterium]|jgi:hypothetical protein|nr:hypothetical protein [Campylobacteraceae bacterium]
MDFRLKKCEMNNIKNIIIYLQSGDLTHIDDAAGTRTPEARGYSGNGNGINNPNLQTEGNVGPIPQGTWNVGQQRDSDHTGSWCFTFNSKNGNSYMYDNKQAKYHYMYASNLYDVNSYNEVEFINSSYRILFHKHIRQQYV